MKRQTGYVFPSWAIYALAAAVALAALWYAYDTVDGRGYARGQSETGKAYAERDNKALKEALAKVQELEAEIRARAAAHGEELASISRQHEKERTHADRQRDADIAAVVAGTLRMRDPGATRRTADGGGGAEAAAGESAGQCDAAPRSELSAAASGFLLQLVHDADAVTRQLSRAQDVIRAQLKACNGP